MLENYVKIALRNLRRQKGYAFVNVAGLSIGLACSFFILLWVLHEASFDRFHESGDRLYRVYRNEQVNGETVTSSTASRPLAEVLRTDFPEIENATNILVTRGSFLVSSGDRSFREEGHYAGADFFEVFSFPFIQGDPASALQVENSVVITEAVAARLFGADWRGRDVVGRRVTLDREEDFTVTGVAENVPDHSSLRFDVVVSIQEFFAENKWTEHWGNPAFPLFVRLREGARASDVNAKLAGLTGRHAPDLPEDEVFLYPFEDTYLRGTFENGINTGGRIGQIRLFGVVAVFLLVIASINFMNLATARSTQRSREIGVRKAVGATRRSLAGQFMAESMILAGVAFVLALALVVALLPAFNLITGKHVGVLDLSPVFLAAVFVISVLVGLLAGTYPALYLSSFQPVAILRGTFRQKPGEATLRKGLVVFQFALSTLLIVCTAAVYLQIRYIMEKDLGLDRDNVVSLALEGGVRAQYETFRQEAMKQPGIVNVTASGANPLLIGNSNTGDMHWEGRDPEDRTQFDIISAHYDFAETMRMRVVAGRTHARAFAGDSAGYLINEQMAKLMGKADPVGEKLAFWGRPGHVIGVIADFHTTTMDAPIAPTVFRLAPEDTHTLWVRVQAGRTQEALAGLEAVYARFNPDYPFTYTFLDREYEAMYRGVLVLGRLANVFAVIAVVISCLGLFGLASFTTERRRKEIGIRKVLGASAARLVVALSMDFTKLVLAGFVLAVPAGYLVISAFLSGYAYHVGISPALFAAAGAGALVIAWATVGYQSFRAAAADPVKSLRSE